MSTIEEVLELASHSCRDCRAALLEVPMFELDVDRPAAELNLVGAALVCVACDRITATVDPVTKKLTPKEHA